MKEPKKQTTPKLILWRNLNSSPATIGTLRSWIPAEEFCQLYQLPKTRPARTRKPKYPTLKLTACRKCCERLSAQGLITTRKIDGHLYVSRDSAITFGDVA